MALLSLIGFALFGFCVWMLVDCLTQPVKDRAFWALIILIFGPFGGIIYAIKRGKLLGESKSVTTTPDGVITFAPVPTRSSRAIRGIGMTIGIVLGVSGLLVVGFVILFISAMSSYGSSK